MGRASAAWLAATERYLVAEFAGPTGMLYFTRTTAGVSDEDGYYYRPVVSSWGEPFVEAADIDGLALAGASTRSLEIVEPPGDSFWSMMTSSGYAVSGSQITFLIAARDVARANWYELWTGRLEAGWENPSPHTWRLSFRSLAATLESQIQRELNESRRPTIDQAVSGALAPLVFGHFDSYASAQKGVIPCVRDSATAYTYTAAWWRTKELTRVYSAGALKTLGADYSVAYPDTGGVLDTVITFTADQSTNAITADAEGYESVGDGTGTLVDDEVDILELLLHNFVFNDRSGQSAWYTRATAPVLGIDTASFDAAKVFLASRANATTRRGSWLIRTARTGLDLCNEWSARTGLPLYWTFGGKLAILVDSPHKDAYVTVAGAIVLASECSGPIGYPVEGSRAHDRVVVSLGISEAGLVQKVRFGDSSGAADREIAISLASGPAGAR